MELNVVKLETAKKLKKVGFNSLTMRYYHPNYGLCNDFSRFEDALRNPEEAEFMNKNTGNWAKGYYSAPTQALVQMWFRDKHNISIEIDWDTITYDCTVIYPDIEPIRLILPRGTYFLSYEQALEAGILEAIKLIK